MEIEVLAIEPEVYFSYAWHPYAVDLKIDYSRETPTLVEFRLETIAGGTLLKVSESGFDRIPSQRRAEAFRMHSQGWERQMENAKAYAELGNGQRRPISELTIRADQGNEAHPAGGNQTSPGPRRSRGE
jgi:hypothetical protein